MQRTRSNRGSAFILVIGVMTTLAMIGSIFFLVAMADKKESIARTTAAPTKTVVEGEIQRIADALAADLYISGSSGPYSGAGADADTYRRYIDYANGNLNDTEDAFLASTERAWSQTNATFNGVLVRVNAGFWPQISNLVGYPVTGVKNVDPGDAYLWCGNNWTADHLRALCDDGGTDADDDPDSIPLIDADGDGVRDSLLYPTGTFDKDGEEYFAAVRIVDLSAFVNVNTASDTDDWAWMTIGAVNPERLPQTWPDTVPTATASWDASTPGALWGVVRTDMFPMEEVSDGRWTGTPPTGYTDYNINAPDIYNDYVRRPGNPSAGSVRPYDWADEFACRWLDTAWWSDGPTATAQPGLRRMAESRLKKVVLDNCSNNELYWAAYGRYLTTGSACRILPRPTDPTVDSNWQMTPAKVNLNRSLADRQNAFHRFRRGFYHLLADADSEAVDNNDGVNAQDKRCVAAQQMAVNLIDYRDGDDYPTVVERYDENYAVVNDDFIMGVERQPFIIQAWSKFDDMGTIFPDPNFADDDVNYMALVLYNPYDEPISIRDWRICASDTGDDFDIKNGGQLDKNSSVLGSKDFLVVYNHVNVNIAGGVDTVDVADSQMHPNKVVTIYRPGRDLTTGTLAQDMADAIEGNKRYVPVGRVEMHNDSNGVKNWLRDMRTTEHRFTVAEWDTTTFGAEDYDSAAGATQLTATKTHYDSLDFTGHAAFDDIPQTPVLVRGFDDNADGVADDDMPLLNVAELNRIFVFGPDRDNGPLDVRLEAVMGSDKDENRAAGRLDNSEDADLDWAGNPEMPQFCLAADLFVVESPLEDTLNPADPGTTAVDNDGDGEANESGTSDWAHWNRETRVMGRININTATVATMAALPLLPDPATEDKRLEAAASLVAYRDGCDPISGLTHFYFQGARRTSLSMTSLREQQGFASAGEPAVLLRDTIKFPVRNQYPAGNWTVDPATPAYVYAGTDDGYVRGTLHDDLTKYDLRYAYLSNLLTVNSDTYCAYIYIQKGPDPTVANLATRRYMVILDRSNCFTDTDRPMVRALAEVK